MARRKLGPWLRFAVIVLRPTLLSLTKRDWRGTEHLPPSGGVVLVTNHISYFDPLAVSHFVYDNRREPRFLAKAALFRIPFVGRVVSGAGQIPVYRESRDAAKALSAAIEAIHRGECVIIYPEGTVTRDPDLWPMVGKTGAARIALATGAPVVPVAQWGAHEVVAPYDKRVRLFPRKTMRFLAGPPVDLDDLRGQEPSADVLKRATDRIMDDLTRLLGELRGEQPPAVRFDPRTAGLPTTGDPKRAVTRRPDASDAPAAGERTEDIA